MSVKKNKVIDTLQYKRPDGGRLLFEVIDLSRPDREIPSTIHRHDFYEIVIIFQGQTRHLVDFNTYTVNSREVLIIPKGSIHQGGFGENLKGLIILFMPAFFTKEQYSFLSHFEIFNVYHSSKHIRFNAVDWDRFIQLLGALQQEYFVGPEAINKEAVRFLFLALATKFNEFVTVSTISKPQQPGLLKTFFSLLENNFKSHHSVEFYCTKLNMSSKKLAQSLSSATSKTTMGLINERLVLEAKRELSFSEKSVKEIAFELGFEDALYFSRFFKKHNTCSPESFRKNFAEESM